MFCEFFRFYNIYPTSEPCILTITCFL